MASPHGIPVDLLDRLVIIRTQTYDVADMIKVIVWSFLTTVDHIVIFTF